MSDSNGPNEHHLHLLQQVQAGDQTALKELFSELGSTIKALAFRMLGSAEDAEEVMQDTFVVLYNKSHSYSAERASVKTFAYGIAHKLCLERLRTRSSRPQKVEEWDVHDPETETLAAGSHHQDDRIVVEKAMGILDPTEKKLIEMSFFDGYSHSELVEHTGMALGTLKSKLRRALLKLKATLEGI